MNDLPKCAVEGCTNQADPRWYVHINGAALPACDGHGCDAAQPCDACARIRRQLLEKIARGLRGLR